MKIDRIKTSGIKQTQNFGLQNFFCTILACCTAGSVQQAPYSGAVQQAQKKIKIFFLFNFSLFFINTIEAP